ncbi:MAG: hypothetical protein ACOYK9_03125 [Chlamydiia bacterium]
MSISSISSIKEPLIDHSAKCDPISPEERGRMNCTAEFEVTKVTLEEFLEPKFFSTQNFAVSFFIIRLDPQFPYKQDSLLFFNWAYSMTQLMRYYFLTDFVDKESLNAKIREYSLFPDESESTDLIESEFLSLQAIGYKLFFSNHCSTFLPLFSGTLSIEPLIFNQVEAYTLSYRLEQIEQLDIKEGCFADILYPISTPCHCSERGIFSLPVAFLLEKLYALVIIDPELSTFLKKEHLNSRNIQKHTKVFELFSNLMIEDPALQDTILHHLSIAVSNWNAYVSKAFYTVNFRIPKKIEPLHFSSLKKAYLHKCIDLKIPIHGKNIFILNFLESLHQRVFDSTLEFIQLRLFIDQFWADPDEELRNWYLTGTLPSISKFLRVIGKLEEKIGNLPNITPELRIELLDLLKKSHLSWDRFVAKTLRIDTMIDGF